MGHAKNFLQSAFLHDYLKIPKMPILEDN